MSNGQTATSGTQPANVAEVLDRLQRELAEGTVSGAFPSLFSPRSSQGPIIADITDEPDANSLAASVSAAASTLTQNICSTQSQQGYIFLFEWEEGIVSISDNWFFIPDCH